MERILEGNSRGLDIDNFESVPMRNPQLEDLRLEAMRIGRPPEEWGQLGEEEKDQLREIIRRLRAVGIPEDLFSDRGNEPPQKRDLF